MSLLSGHCKYIGEGNAHVVLKLLHTNYVLRLSKQYAGTVDINNVKLSIRFVNKVMSPLFNPVLAEYEIIELSESELNELIHTLEETRPKHRKIQSGFSKYAVKAPNLLIVAPDYGNYCIEIKPKEGFMSARVKEYSKCYYCMKQFLKFKELQINSISKYCPLDLFSGDKKRMKYALYNLINNPQNNFKLFRDNEMIYGEQSSFNKFCDILNAVGTFNGSINLFLDFLIEILLSNNKNIQINVQERVPMSVTEISKTKCNEKCHLSTDSFLYNLLFVQKLSENVNCEVQSEGIDYVTSILDELENAPIEPINKFMTRLNPLQKAMISAIAKDCSIMLSFSLKYIEHCPSIVIGEDVISYRLAVTDLEPKSAKTIGKRKRTEEKLINIYKDHIQLIGNYD